MLDEALGDGVLQQGGRIEFGDCVRCGCFRALAGL
jgi:hypothetical protein